MNPKYAISLQHEFIALFETRDGSLWKLVERVALTGLDEAQILPTLTPPVEAWRGAHRAIEVWFPGDVARTAAIESFDELPNFVDNFHREADFIDPEYIVGTTKITKPESDTEFRLREDNIFVIHARDYREGIDFIESFGFTIIAVGAAPHYDTIIRPFTIAPERLAEYKATTPSPADKVEFLDQAIGAQEVTPPVDWLHTKNLPEIDLDVATAGEQEISTPENILPTSTPLAQPEPDETTPYDDTKSRGVRRISLEHAGRVLGGLLARARPVTVAAKVVRTHPPTEAYSRHENWLFLFGRERSDITAPSVMPAPRASNFAPTRITEHQRVEIPDHQIGRGTHDDFEAHDPLSVIAEPSYMTPRERGGIRPALLVGTGLLLAGVVLGALEFLSRIDQDALPEAPILQADLNIDAAILSQIIAQTDPLLGRGIESEVAQNSEDEITPETVATERAETPPDEAPEITAQPQSEGEAPEPEAIRTEEPVPETVTEAASVESVPVEIVEAPDEPISEASEGPRPNSLAPESPANPVPRLDIPAPRPADIGKTIAIAEEVEGQRPEMEPFEFVARPENFISPTDVPVPETTPAPKSPEPAPSNFAMQLTRPAARDNDKIVAQAQKIEANAIETAQSQLNNGDASPDETAVTDTQNDTQTPEQEELAIDIANDTGEGPPSPIGTGRAAGEATMEGALDLSEIALLGVSGKADDPDALVRKPNGEVLTVKRGNLIDDWKVIAINREVVIIARGGEQRTLRTPKF